MFDQLSPDTKAILLPVLGVLAKMMFDSALNILKNTVSTPARVTVLEKITKEEFDAIKGWRADHERDIKRNWERFNDLEKQINDETRKAV